VPHRLDKFLALMSKLQGRLKAGCGQDCPPHENTLDLFRHGERGAILAGDHGVGLIIAGEPVLRGVKT
jgi:hypothetical protein